MTALILANIGSSNWLAAWQHQAITRTNTDLLAIRSSWTSTVKFGSKLSKFYRKHYVSIKGNAPEVIIRTITTILAETDVFLMKCKVLLLQVILCLALFNCLSPWKICYYKFIPPSWDSCCQFGYVWLIGMWFPGNILVPRDPTGTSIPTQAWHHYCMLHPWFIHFYSYCCYNIDGLVQERRNSSALALELCLYCINPLDSVYWRAKIADGMYHFY